MNEKGILDQLYPNSIDSFSFYEAARMLKWGTDIIPPTSLPPSQWGKADNSSRGECVGIQFNPTYPSGGIHRC